MHRSLPSQTADQQEARTETGAPRPAGSVRLLPAWFGLPEGVVVAGFVGLWLPPLVALTPWTAAGVTGAVLAATFSARAARPNWKTALQLFELALAVRLVVLVICFAARGSVGVETVNPDVANYLAWGRDIARYLPAFFDVRSVFQAATNDIGFHYILGLEIWIFGDDPLALLSINAVVGAAAVVAIYGLLRLGGGKLPFLVACVAAFYPGLVFISSGDLFKDPWVLLALLGGLALAFRAAQAHSKIVWRSLAAGLCFFVLHITRFYTLPMSLLCLAAGAIADRRRSLDPPGPWLARWAVVAAGIAVGAAGPALLVKQPSAFEESLSYVHVFHGSSSAFLAADGRIVERMREKGPGHGPVRIAADLVRRFYGPYIWVPPTRDSGSLIEGSYWDYLGVPIWYVLLPVGLISIAALLGSRPPSVAAAALTGSAMTLLLLLVFSLSYRQRSSLLVPFLILVVGFALDRLRWGRLRRVLLLQAGVVIALAAVYYSLIR